MYILFSEKNQFICNNNSLEGIIESIKELYNWLTIKLIFTSDETTINLEVELSDRVQPTIYIVKKI